MAITFSDLQPQDLQDPRLILLNNILRQLADASNSSSTRSEDLDMQGFGIINLKDPVNTQDAMTKNVADASYGSSVVKAAVEATGSKILATTRRLNDQNQREQSSSYMNSLASTPPGANSSSIGVVVSGGNSVITVSAGTQQLADKSLVPYAQRIDTVANPGSNSDFYGYYLRVADKSVQQVFMGNGTSANINTSQNRLQLNLDGRIQIGVAQVNAGGGGSGNPSGGGCTRIGTPLEFYLGAKPQVVNEPCSDWALFNLSDGRELAVDPDTLVSVFVKAKDLKRGDLVEIENGNFLPVANLWHERLKSEKQKVTEPVNKVYLAGQSKKKIRLHNVKP